MNGNVEMAANNAMPVLPDGTVTFLFTDIEGSTRLWERSPDKMSAALSRHDVLLRAAIEAHGGRVFKTVGDAFCVAFASAGAAVGAALAAQQALRAERWPDSASITVRMALHAGAAEIRGADYFGPTLNRVARLLSVGHGGQVLLSAAAAAAAAGALPAGASLLDRGRHGLKDLSSPEEVFELGHPTLPRELRPLRSLSTHPNNLPYQPTSFLGREKEIGEVKELLGRTRLLTLTGAGGCGKTRLAIQLAAELLESFPDGVWLVELAPLADADLVPRAVAAAFGLKERPGEIASDLLVNHLAQKDLLLVLDNVEHVVGSCAPLADAILRRCRRTVLLVTSRQPLGISGEVAYHLPSLSVPDPKRDATPECLSRYEAARLFVERAQSHLPRFAVTERNAPAVASICHRLDGIPLAIELAAARMRSMSAEEVDQRLDQRFRLLTDGSRSALPRHRTLRSLIDWSFDLLSEAERALLCRLSVFSGGRTLEAAERVCGGGAVRESEVLDLLASLVDKNLLAPVETLGTTRYRMLETVRQYAWERLLEADDPDVWRDRHADHFVELAERAEPELIGTQQQAWLDRLELEHDNIRTALSHCAAVGGDAHRGLRLVAAVWRFWFIHGYAREGRGWLDRFLAATSDSPPSPVRARALNGAGALAHQQGDYPAARARYDESLAIRRRLGDRRGIASCLNNLGAAAQEQGDFDAARHLYEEGLALVRALDDRHAIATLLSNLGSNAADVGDYARARAWQEESLTIRRNLGDRKGLGTSLGNLGGVYAYLGDYQAARPILNESLTILRELGDPHGLSYPLAILGTMAADEGDLEAARVLFGESLEGQRKVGNRWGVAVALEGFATVAAKGGQADRAARLWGAAERLREEIGVPLRPNERSAYDASVRDARTAAGRGHFDAAWQDGRTMPLDRAADYARGAS